jgi:hypothetical protein
MDDGKLKKMLTVEVKVATRVGRLGPAQGFFQK